MVNYLKEGYKEKIIIKSEDKEQLEAGREFLENLRRLNDEFVSNLDKAQKEFNDFKKMGVNKNIIFKPEALTRKSPMTLIDAKWGSGKTYFVETLMKNMALNRFGEIPFKNAILIDAWKASMSKESVARLFKNIFESLGEIYPAGKKEKVMKFGELVFEYGKDYTKDRFKIKQTELEGIEKSYEKGIKKIIKNNGTTIIFIDNIERVGRDAWDILKGISKLLVLRGLVVILPLNLQKMHKAYEEDFKNEDHRQSNVENPIEKYLDIKYFEFKQDYVGLLSKLGFQEEECEYYNMVLETVDKYGQLLSVREVEKRIIGSGVLKFEDSEKRKTLFQNNIWSSEEVFKKDMEESLSLCISSLKTIHQEITNDLANMKVSASGANDEFIINKINLHNRKDLNMYNSDPSKNLEILLKYEREFQKLCKEIIREKEKTEVEIGEINSKIINEKVKYEELSKSLELISSKIIKWKTNIQDIEKQCDEIEYNDNSYYKNTRDLKQIYEKKIAKLKLEQGNIRQDIDRMEQKHDNVSGLRNDLQRKINDREREKQTLVGRTITYNVVDLTKTKSLISDFEIKYKGKLVFEKIQKVYENNNIDFNYPNYSEILNQLLNYDFSIKGGE